MSLQNKSWIMTCVLFHIMYLFQFLTRLSLNAEPPAAQLKQCPLLCICNFHHLQPSSSMTETPPPPWSPTSHSFFSLTCPLIPMRRWVLSSFPLHPSLFLSFAPAALPCIIKFSVEVHPPSFSLCCLFLHFSLSHSVFLVCNFVNKKGKTGWTSLFFFFFLSPPSFHYTLLPSGPHWGLVPGLSC